MCENIEWLRKPNSSVRHWARCSFWSVLNSTSQGTIPVCSDSSATVWSHRMCWRDPPHIPHVREGSHVCCFWYPQRCGAGPDPLLPQCSLSHSFSLILVRNISCSLGSSCTSLLLSGRFWNSSLPVTWMPVLCHSCLPVTDPWQEHKSGPIEKTLRSRYHVPNSGWSLVLMFPGGMAAAGWKVLFLTVPRPAKILPCSCPGLARTTSLAVLPRNLQS